jgi:hypothetical protein
MQAIKSDVQLASPYLCPTNTFFCRLKDELHRTAELITSVVQDLSCRQQTGHVTVMTTRVHHPIMQGLVLHISSFSYWQAILQPSGQWRYSINTGPITYHVSSQRNARSVARPATNDPYNSGLYQVSASMILLSQKWCAGFANLSYILVDLSDAI